ncbi:hypothetical protein OC834_000486 [Tilletia horrida]|nr:hypothetical protein OC834_000486 [Tilletia horrida]
MQAYTERGLVLKLVSRKFAQATTQHFRQHLHAFGPPHPVTAIHQPWHPPSYSAQLRAHFWGQLYGPKQWNRYPNLALAQHSLTLTSIPSLRTLSLDIRRKTGHYELRGNGVRASNGPIISNILTRLIESAHNLEELNLRISPDQETIDAVERLLCVAPALRGVVIEVDCLGDILLTDVTFRLANITKDPNFYRSLEHFVLRCPGVTVDCEHTQTSESKFACRLLDVKQFAISARRLKGNASDWQWLWALLQRTRVLQACQLSIDLGCLHWVPSTISEDEVAPLALHHLTDLILEMPGIDTHLLRKLDAPQLSNLCFRTNVEDRFWPLCKFNQFPSLSRVTVWTNGPSAARLSRLGVPFCKFWRNLDAFHNYEHCHSFSFSATIHGPAWAPFKTVLNDHDALIWNLPLPTMKQDEERTFDIPVGRYQYPAGEPVDEAPNRLTYVTQELTEQAELYFPHDAQTHSQRFFSLPMQATSSPEGLIEPNLQLLSNTAELVKQGCYMSRAIFVKEGKHFARNPHTATRGGL